MGVQCDGGRAGAGERPMEMKVDAARAESGRVASIQACSGAITDTGDQARQRTGAPAPCPPSGWHTQYNSMSDSWRSLVCAWCMRGRVVGLRGSVGAQLVLF